MSTGSRGTCEEFNFDDLCSNPQAFLHRLDRTPAPTLVASITPKFGEVETNEIEVIVRRRMPGDCPDRDPAFDGDENLGVSVDPRLELEESLRKVNSLLEQLRTAEVQVVYPGTPTPDVYGIAGPVQVEWREDGPFPMLILRWEYDGPYPL